jgi:hypothetical protein
MLRSKHQILNRNSQPLNRRSDKFDFCREPSTNSPFSCKTNPICTNRQYDLASLLTEAYVKNAKFSPPKANPNKPKQSQYDPHFSPVRGTQSQSKPKQTQSNPISLCPTERTQPPISQRLAELHKKSQNFLRFLLHWRAYCVILQHITEDVTLCS